MSKYTNIQEYINKEYTKKITFDSTTLELSEKGELIIDGYSNLEEVYKLKGKDLKNITKVTITNCPQLKEVNIIKFVDNQKLEIDNCPNLEKLWCGNNNLSELDFLNSLNSQKLESLILESNNLPTQDLTIFTPFQNLKELRISGISKPSYFTGSLKPLQDLKKLEMLNISGTDITHGLEFLPYSVKDFYCSPYRSESKVTDIYEELQPFGGDINKWREVKLEKQPYLLMAPLMPLQLKDGGNELSSDGKKELNELITRSELSNELATLLKQLKIQDEQYKQENYNLPEINYNQIHFNHWKLNTPSLSL